MSDVVGTGMNTVSDAVDAMRDMDLDAPENTVQPTSSDVERFAETQRTAGEEPEAKSSRQKDHSGDDKQAEDPPQASDDAGDHDDDEDYIEWEVPASEEGKDPETHRVKASEVLAGYHRVQQLEGELANVRQTAPPPPDYDNAIQDALTHGQNYQRGLQVVAQFLQSPPPDKSLIDPNSASYNPDLYYQETQLAEERAAQFNTVAAELNRIEQENSQHMETLQRARFEREQRKLMEMWPELSEETHQRDVTDSVSKFYGIDQETLNSVHDSRFYAVLKDALAYRKAQAKQSAAVKVVKAKPKLVKGKARSSQSASQRNRSKAMERLQQTGSFDDAADALEGLL